MNGCDDGLNVLVPVDRKGDSIASMGMHIQIIEHYLSQQSGFTSLREHLRIRDIIVIEPLIT